jgi:hypothetical protein
MVEVASPAEHSGNYLEAGIAGPVRGPRLDVGIAALQRPLDPRGGHRIRWRDDLGRYRAARGG